MKHKLPTSEFACDLAHAAGQVLTKYFRRVKHIETKLNAGIVTEADKLAEALLLKKIFSKFPESSIIAEESGEFRRGDHLTWMLDPLDGTTNYAHGFPWFCVSIGLYVNAKPYLGVVYQPVSKEMFVAVKGRGAFLNGKRIRVTKERRINSSLLGTGFYYSRGSVLSYDIEIFRKVNDVARGVRRPGSAALDLACVASGRYDGFWERGLAPWDVAAGFLLVTEAGGKVSNYRGENTSPFDAEALATNGKIHRAMIDTIQSASTRRR